MLYMVCDGHSGVDAAEFVMENFRSLLCARVQVPLLARLTQGEHVTTPRSVSAHHVVWRLAGGQQGMQTCARMLREAICDTLIQIESDWSVHEHLAG